MISPLRTSSFCANRNIYKFNMILHRFLKRSQKGEPFLSNLPDNLHESLNSDHPGPKLRIKDILKFPCTYSTTGSEFLKEIDTTHAKPLKWTGVNFILNNTEPLDKWRRQKIRQYDGGIFSTSLVSDSFQKAEQRGEDFHQTVFNYLSGGANCDPTNVSVEGKGLWKSVQHVLSKISEPVLEKSVQHPYLGYYGTLDCMCKLNNELTVLDWKTASRKKLYKEQLFDHPLQVAAYVGAINFDPSFTYKDVNRCALVIVYESGVAADIIHLDIEENWKLWLQRLANFHARNSTQL